MNFKILIFDIIILGLIVSGFVLWREYTTRVEEPITSEDLEPNQDKPKSPTPEETESPVNDYSKPVLINVPFTSQSPLAEWKDPRQQDGCEEASVLMAMYWIQGKSLTDKNLAKEKILEISQYQTDNFGEFHDTSANDTAKRIIEGFFGYKNYEVVNDIELSDILRELYSGNVIIVPANGRELNNPNFTQPGPERHMLLIKGYDPSKKQFITNDPGIRQGNGYRYPENVLYNAVRDYPTGYHVPITGISKVMIVVRKS